MPVYRPPNYVEHFLRKRPLVFLGGPIQGAEDWQAKAIAWFEQHAPTLIVASPRSGMWNKDLPEEERDRLWHEQYNWEHIHLDQAMRKGVVMFWLAPEVEHIPGRAYAQTTRVELSAILGYQAAKMGRNLFCPSAARRPSDCLVVGAHPDFLGRRYLESFLDGDHWRILHDTFERTCEETLEVLRFRYRD